MKYRNVLSNIMILASSSAVSRVILFLMMPIVSRLYSPVDFGVFALFTSMLAITGVVAGGKYNEAIMVAADSDEAATLLSLSVYLSLLFSVTIGIGAFFYCDQLVAAYPKLSSEVLVLLPAGVFLFSVRDTLTSWHNRIKGYSVLARMNYFQSASQGGAQLAASTVSTSSGLIVGYLFGFWVSIATLRIKNFSFEVDRRKLKRIFLNYRRFPIFSATGTLFNSVGLQFPVLFFGYYFSADIVGQFGMAYRILTIPSAVISIAIYKVIQQKLLELIAEKRGGEIRPFILKSTALLISLYLPVIIVISLWGNELFSFVLGSEWGVAGNYSQILVFSTAISFVVSPLSGVMVVGKNIQRLFWWKLIYCLTTIGCLYFFSQYDFDTILIAYVLNQLALYIIYFILICNAGCLANRG